MMTKYQNGIKNIFNKSDWGDQQATGILVSS